jgi:hypothetical protein
MAMCDAKCRFTIIDLGALGREGDKGIFTSSLLYQRFENGQLGIAPPRQQPCSDKTLPYVLVGDQGFPLPTVNQSIIGYL